MLNQKRSRIYKIWALITAIIFFAGGIILGFVFKTTEYTGSGLFSTPMAEQHFNWSLMFILWFSAILPVLSLYAIYIHLDNQEQMLVYLKSICPAEISTAAYHPASKHISTQQAPSNTVWQCKICGTENTADSTVCSKCGWSAQPEK